MTETPRREDWIRRRIAGWRDAAGRWTAGATFFLLLSGLSIYLLPFSVFNQHAVLVHTLAGLLFLIPTVLFVARHLAGYLRFPLTHVNFSGWALGAMLLACTVSGLVLTAEGAFGTRITYLWDTVHVVTTFGVLIFLFAHLVPLWLRGGRGAPDAAAPAVVAGLRGHQRIAFGAALGMFLATGALTVLARPMALVNEFPPDYDAEAYGDKGPFAPSKATTVSGGAIDPRALSDSASCGTSRCHAEIYEEWLPSAHRYASLDAGFQAIQSVMAEQNGADSTRYCGGCHDPISLFSGTKNIGVTELTSLAGYQEGVSCLVCHAIQKTDVAGNANYVIAPPVRYVWELLDGALPAFLADFLIRVYPEQHIASLSRRMFKTPEFCAACHKQFIDEEVNQVGWVQLQNQFDNWRASRWFTEGDAHQTVECRECHMPLLVSRDPAAGDAADYNRHPGDGQHRSHRFLGANQYIPVLAGLEGGQEHAAMVEEWLKGEYPVPEIAGKWRNGPAIPIELDVPASVAPGEEMEVLVHITNNKAGHDFPTGPLDIIQAWVEIEVRDAAGAVVFHSGTVDESNFVAEGTFMFKAEPVDRYGNLIDRHNLWEMVGVRFKRSLFPGSEEVTSYAFDCVGAREGASEPPRAESVAVAVPDGTELQSPLTVTARLNYRKFDQYLLNYVFGADSGLTAPITVLSAATAEVPLIAGSR
ncbi:MAG: multiheme c-type cytochrome [Planctomycetota bacterium]